MSEPWTESARIPRFAAGPVISRSLRILSRNLGVFVPVAAFVTLPNTLLKAEGDGDLLRAILAAILAAILFYAAQGFIAYGAYQAAQGREAAGGETLLVALERFFPLVWLAGWVGLMVGIGLVLLIVPGILFLVMWSVAVPACVVEGKRPLAAMRRSAELTRGHRWTLLGLYLLLFIGAELVLIIVKEALAIAATASVEALGSWLARAVVAAFQAVVAAVVYHDLRVAGELAGGSEATAKN